MSKKLLQINVTANWGSTGKIAEDIGNLAISDGWESWIAYGRGNPVSKSNLIRIGNDLDMRLHGVQSRLLDNHGLASRSATKKFIRQIREINPDVIHLHNIHGYFLNYPLLFEYLKEWGGPVVWTLHDCWPFTGHCAYYEFAACDRWKTGCHNCPQLRSYPASLLCDRSSKNYTDKVAAFLGCANLTLVPVSDWLYNQLSQSFLRDYSRVTIHNGINLQIFRHTAFDSEAEKMILGVASVWEKRKGLEEFVKLREQLSDEYKIVLVGLTDAQVKALPEGITGITRTENVQQLVELYSRADVFVNPTLEDNFPTTNLEALACGTPVITYSTGGSPEAVAPDTGIVVEKGDINGLVASIETVVNSTSKFTADICRSHAERYYDKNDCFKRYIALYNQVLKI